MFNRSPVGAVALVEPPVSQWYVRRAQVTALVVGLAVNVTATAVLSVFYPLLLAVALGALAGLVLGMLAGVLVRIWPVLRVLWWWSVEITAASVVVGGWVALAHLAAWWTASVAVLAAAVACVVVGPVRRRLSAWSWCLVDRHRLRLCFDQITRSSGRMRPGALPLVLWVRPTPAGERAWLWLRPGLELADLDGKAGRIAVTCWADRVRALAASERYAALIRVDIGRRDPLTGEIPSPLALLVPSLRRNHQEQGEGAPVLAPVPAVGLELADIDEEPVVPQRSRGGRG